MSKLSISAIPVELIDVVWPQCVEHINRVVEKAPEELSLDDIYRRLIVGETLLVTISDKSDIIAVNILERRYLGNGLSALYIPITGGTRMAEWMVDFLDVAKAIAKDLGCKQLRGLAVRKGWMKKLKPMGWQVAYEVIKCDVENE